MFQTAFFVLIAFVVYVKMAPIPQDPIVNQRDPHREKELGELFSMPGPENDEDTEFILIPEFNSPNENVSLQPRPEVIRHLIEYNDEAVRQRIAESWLPTVALPKKVKYSIHLLNIKYSEDALHYPEPDSLDSILPKLETRQNSSTAKQNYTVKHDIGQIEAKAIVNWMTSFLPSPILTFYKSQIKNDARYRVLKVIRQFDF